MSLNWKTTLYIFLFLGIAFVVVYLLPDSANNSSKPETDPITESAAIPPQNIAKGKKLADVHCQSCHSYPAPGLLPKGVWQEQTLPHMGPQLGIIEHNGDKYPVERTPNLPENYYPAEPQISQDEWQYITDYYLASAPEQLETKQDHPPITEDSLFFRARTPNFREQTPPMVSSIRFDPGNQLIYLSDASNSMFYVFDQNLAFKDRYQLSSAISDIRFKNDGQTAGRRELLTTYIGDVNPSDAKSGFIQEVWYEPEVEQGGAGKMLQEDLARPVETQIADFDLDGSDDLLVNEFAHRTGKLFWLSDAWGDSPQMNLLINSSGCIESKIMDYTGNGFPDILALCTQLDQSIYLFKNLGEGEFERERLLQFPITAGSSSFKLVDFNGDGHLDILYTSGDNADYSITFKPYHGVYIYLNDGQGNFTQKWFYPINGAYDAIAKDFDKNGNLDIAVISFFANYQEKPEEGFVFFKGDSILDFTPYHPPAANTGRWIAMDVADWNRDGYDDIVLANFSKGPIRVVDRIQDSWFQGPHFLLLENIAGTLE